MSSNRPETSAVHSSTGASDPQSQVALDNGNKIHALSAAAATIERAVPPPSYSPHVFDLHTPVHRARDSAKLYIPPAFLQSEAVDSSIAIGHGASFDVTRQAIPSGPATIKQRTVLGSDTVVSSGTWAVSHSFPAPQRPKYVVYKTARVNFARDGKPVSPADKRALLSVLTEFYALLHPPLQAHANIVDFLGLAWSSHPRESSHRLPILVLELGDLGTLADVQSHGVAPDNNQKAQIVLGIARGLQILHESGIVHGDVKPENIIMCSHAGGSMVPKLADFGFAILADSETQIVTIGGTNTWRAPETYGPVAASMLHLTDVYSFGLVVWSTASWDMDPLQRLLFSTGLHGAEFHAHLRHLKEADQLVSMSKFENWMFKSTMPVLDNNSVSDRSTFVTVQKPKTQLHNTDVQQRMTSTEVQYYRGQTFYKVLEDIFVLTLSGDPMKRDLTAAMKLLESQSITAVLSS
jgi:serine/threonine protein kinase